MVRQWYSYCPLVASPHPSAMICARHLENPHSTAKIGQWSRVREWSKSKITEINWSGILGAAAAVCTIVGLFTAMR
ncbi:hypothetical protein DL93DRAFT_2083196 [Clavulina sp. PMI_390]|nr:hypothetical protein DL93DRAFT_2083196 [Clavulina sp. PMI_390]